MKPPLSERNSNRVWRPPHEGIVGSRRSSTCLLFFSDSINFLGDEDEAFPEERKPSRPVKTQHIKSVLGEQLRQRRPTPELDMAAVHKRSMVKIPFVCKREREILQVAVIWSRDHEKAAVPQNCFCIERQQVRGVEMLNDLAGNDGVELLAVFLGKHFKWVVLHSLVCKT